MTVTPLSAWAQTAAPGGKSSDLAAEDTTALLRQVLAEVRQLRTELRQQQLENLEMKIAQLEREAQQARAEQQHLQEQERTFSQEVLELDQRLGRETPGPDEPAGLEAARAELLRKELERVRDDQQKVAQRETDLAKRLEREQRRRHGLVEKLKKLRAGASEGSIGLSDQTTR